MTLPDPYGGPPLPLRVGDGERQAVVRRLEGAHAEGRISAVELLERSDLAWRARTKADLEPLVDDLPAAGVALPYEDVAGAAGWRPPGGGADRRAVAVLGSSLRRGRWRPNPEFTAVAVLGSCDLDLRAADVPGGAVTITAISVLGAVTVVVPPGAEVSVSGLSLLGARSAEVRPVVGAPELRIRVRGFAVLGGVHVHERARAEAADGPACGR